MADNKKQLINCYLYGNIEKEIIFTAKLKDNTQGYFYFVEPECKECIAQGLKMLSSTSRSFRFNYAVKKFSKIELKYLTDIDNYNHLSIGCHNPDKSDYPGMGIARYIRLAEKPDTAEIAITVLDEYQNKGLGTILLSLLVKYGVKNDILFFCGYVKANNQAMLALLDRFGFQIKRKEYSLLYIEAELSKCYEQTERVLQTQRS